MQKIGEEEKNLVVAQDVGGKTAVEKTLKTPNTDWRSSYKKVIGLAKTEVVDLQLLQSSEKKNQQEPEKIYTVSNLLTYLLMPCYILPSPTTGYEALEKLILPQERISIL